MLDKKTLIINDLPYGQTTTSVIDSILKANERGKIKIRKIDDNTSEKVEILIHLMPGTDPDITMDALYAFTDCEVSISSNACVIMNEKPSFIGVSSILKLNHLLNQLRGKFTQKALICQLFPMGLTEGGDYGKC